MTSLRRGGGGMCTSSLATFAVCEACDCSWMNCRALRPVARVGARWGLMVFFVFLYFSSARFLPTFSITAPPIGSAETRPNGADIAAPLLGRRRRAYHIIKSLEGFGYYHTIASAPAAASAPTGRDYHINATEGEGVEDQEFLARVEESRTTPCMARTARASPNPKPTLSRYSTTSLNSQS
jgi:hypothetical protein